MKILIMIEHPARVHMFKNLIKILEKKNNKVMVLVIKKDINTKLLDNLKIKYFTISESSGTNLFNKILIFCKTTYHIYMISKNYKPDIFLGVTSPMMSVVSFILKKPHIAYEDTEFSPIETKICQLFSKIIITPKHFEKNLGKKQVVLNTNKELLYLHPKYFKPNPKYLKENKLSLNEKYVLIRFVSWTATNDIGHHGFSNKEKLKLIKTLSRYCRVLITSEAELPLKFKKYQLKSSPENIHHLIYYSSLFLGEGATMVSEAAVLGTHAFYMSELIPGTIKEFHDKYQIIDIFSNRKTMLKDVIKNAVILLSDKNLFNKSKNIRKEIINDKIDLNNYYINLINKS